MTQERRDALYQIWRNETIDDWRKTLDEEERSYLAELDQRAYEQALQNARREYEDAFEEILASIDPDRVGSIPAELAMAMAVRELRYELLMDREDLSRMTSLSVSDIQAIECCVGNPTFETLNLIAKAVDFPFHLSFAKSS